MTRRLAPLLLGLCLILPLPVDAEILWTTAIPIQIHTGPDTPMVLFGFNPQPEPPPLMVASHTVDPDAAVQELSGIEPTPFHLYVASEGGTFSQPPEPVLDFDTISIPFTTDGGVDLTFVVKITPDGDGDLSTGISDPLFFNPQPEPPPQFDSMGFVFAFEALQSGDAVTATLQVFDESMQPVSMTAVQQVPVTGGLGAIGLPAALLGVWAVRRRWTGPARA